RLLEQFFDIKLENAKLAFGYSLGEPAALMATGVFKFHDLLRVPLALSDDCVALAEDVTLGVLFSRGSELDGAAVERLCLQITSETKATLAVPARLSPNSLLLLGQRDTVDRFKDAMAGVLPEQTHLRKNPQHWPPLHTPITRLRCVPDRTAVGLAALPGG